MVFSAVSSAEFGKWEGGVKNLECNEGEGFTYLETCPSRKRTVFICERRSGSWVVGV